MNAASSTRLVVRAFFDGERLLDGGPYRFNVKRGLLVAIAPAPGAPVDVEFLLPPLADCHVHCFLDGSLTDDAARKRHLASGFDSLLATARPHAAAARQCGIA